MSAKCSGRVWELSQQKGSELLLLLAIADHAKDDGSGAWPSVESLAKKTRLSERNIQYLLRKLEASGELQVQRGAGPYGTHLYAIVVGGVQSLHPEKFAPGATQRTKGVQPSVKGGAIAIAPKPLLTIKEPSVKSARRENAKPAKSKRVPIPDSFPLTDDMRSYIQRECPVLLGTLEKKHRYFVRYWTEGDGQGARKSNWLLTWEKWMEREAQSVPRPGGTNGNGKYETKQDATNRYWANLATEAATGSPAESDDRLDLRSAGSEAPGGTGPPGRP